MATAAVDPDDARAQAASLAFALLRFEEAAAHPFGGTTAAGALGVGVDAYIFSPSWRRVPLDSVVGYLVGLPSPALLMPTTTRGIIALTLLNELSGERRAWAQKTVDNNRACLESLVKQSGLADDARVILEFSAECHIFSLAVLRSLADQFAVNVGWNLSVLSNDPRADARMNLRRSDGLWSSGRVCHRE